MGCSSSHDVVNEQATVGYQGRGTDYLNYNFYDAFYKQKRDAGVITEDEYQAWIAYYLKNFGDGGHHSGDFETFMNWIKQSKKANVKRSTLSAVNLNMDESVTVMSVGAEAHDAAGDSAISRAEAGRISFFTLGTALRITVLKTCDVEPSMRISGLKVRVINLLSSTDEIGINFFKKKPTIKTDQKFVDNSFSNLKALGQKYSNMYAWKRPQEIMPNEKICLFHEGTSIEDIDQGVFGSCYFLAVLTGMVNNQEVMRRIILPDSYDINSGRFHCQFWRFGQWHDIHVDDYLPCDSNGLVGCKSYSCIGEMWIPLMEKAYAKFCGGYEELDGGTPRDAFMALTGGFAEWLALSYYEFDSADVFQRIDNALRQGTVIVCSTTPQGDLTAYVKEHNIVVNHAYTVTATALIDHSTGNIETLVKLKNPWSRVEWTGAWNDRSPEWFTLAEPLREQLRKIEEDGEFWMPWSEFWKIFTDITICSFSPDFDKDGRTDNLDNVTCVYGEWTADLCGGIRNLSLHPTFELSLPHHGTDTSSVQSEYVVAELIQKVSTRRQRTSPGNIMVKHILKHPQQAVYISEENFTTSNPIVRRLEIQRGHKYHIQLCKYNPNETGIFLLRLFSQYKIHLRPLTLTLLNEIPHTNHNRNGRTPS